MARLIDADALILICKERISICEERIRRRQEPNSSYDFSASVEHIACTATEYEKCIELLESTPTIDPVHAAAEALDVSPDRLRELAQAEKEGRLVVLPCKIGEKLYIYGCPSEPIEEWKILHLSLSYSAHGVISSVSLGIIGDAMGKTIFLSLEAAEAALDKRECTK